MKANRNNIRRDNNQYLCDNQIPFPTLDKSLQHKLTKTQKTNLLRRTIAKLVQEDQARTNILQQREEHNTHNIDNQQVGGGSPKDDAASSMTGTTDPLTKSDDIDNNNDNNNDNNCPAEKKRKCVKHMIRVCGKVTDSASQTMELLACAQLKVHSEFAKRKEEELWEMGDNSQKKEDLISTEKAALAKVRQEKADLEAKTQSEKAALIEELTKVRQEKADSEANPQLEYAAVMEELNKVREEKAYSEAQALAIAQKGVANLLFAFWANGVVG
jgi:hypothetical protein